MKILCIVGATATGKSARAVQIAKERNGEIINADSRQLYRGCEIGTGVPTVREREGVAHHLYAFLDPNESLSVAEWKQLVLTKIQEVSGRGRLPILVGGTGLYISAIVDNPQFPEVPPQPEIRARFTTESLEDLVKELLALDPDAEEEVDLKNPRRVQRALEVSIVTGKPFTKTKVMGPKLVDAEILHLEVPREELRERIRMRVHAMLDVGWLDEVRALQSQDIEKNAPGLTAIGYRELYDVLDGATSLEEATEQIILKTVQYAKRQETWFRKYV